MDMMVQNPLQFDKEFLETAIENAAAPLIPVQDIAGMVPDNPLRTMREPLAEVFRRRFELKRAAAAYRPAGAEVARWLSQYYGGAIGTPKHHGHDGFFHWWLFCNGFHANSALKELLAELPHDRYQAIGFLLEMLGVKERADVERLLQELLFAIEGWACYLKGLAQAPHHNTVAVADCLVVGLFYCALSNDGKGTLVEGSLFPDSDPDPERLSEVNLRELLANNERPFVEKLLAALDREGRSSEQPRTTGKVLLASCMDGRMSYFERALAAAGIDSARVPGFFGFPVEIKQTGNTRSRRACPAVVQSPLFCVQEHPPEGARNRNAFIGFMLKLHESVKSDSLAAFQLVTIVGLVLGVRTIWKACFPGVVRGVTRYFNGGVRIVNNPPRLDLSLIPVDEQAALCQALLKASGWEEKILRGQNENGPEGAAPKLGLVVAHDTEQNNQAHKAAAACGACQGPGYANALSLVNALNNPAVRRRYEDLYGKRFPSGFLAIAACLNTTAVTLEILGPIRASHRSIVEETAGHLRHALRNAREARWRLLPSGLFSAFKWVAADDPANPLPEESLLFTSAVVAGTEGFLANALDFPGQVFHLGPYDWNNDDCAATDLAGIFGAMMVADDIHSGYWVPALAPNLFGPGTACKTRLEPCGPGVLEGTGYDLMYVLPKQSIGLHCDDNGNPILATPPMRTQCVVEAPLQYVDRALAANPELARRVQDGKLVLFAKNPGARGFHQALGNGAWIAVNYQTGAAVVA
jgi:uncharacterized protein YbcC (UPF0753/DUF2309 family)